MRVICSLFSTSQGKEKKKKTNVSNYDYVMGRDLKGLTINSKPQGKRKAQLMQLNLN